MWGKMQIKTEHNYVQISQTDILFVIKQRNVSNSESRAFYCFMKNISLFRIYGCSVSKKDGTETCLPLCGVRSYFPNSQ